MNSQRMSYEVVKASFEKEGYTLLTKTYENNTQKLEYICKRGHRHYVNWACWNSLRKVRCPYCNGNAKLNIEFIRIEFAKEGYILLTEVYKNSGQKLKYICPRGHRHSVSWDAWNSKKKYRCPYCAGNAKLNIEFIRVEFAKEGYELLTKVYENSKQKLEYICPRKRRHFMIWSNWKKGRRCPCFSNNIKLTIEFIRAEFAKEDYILLTTVYEGNKQKLDYICPKEHRHSITWDCWQRGHRCPERSNNISKWEQTVKEFLTESDINHISNDRTQLVNPETGYSLELDIWFPKSNKAIECNGIYWHTKRQRVDLLKKQLCKDQGIDLLVITDKEWNDDVDKCKNKIQEFLC